MQPAQSKKDTASILAFWPLRQLRSLRLLRTFFASAAFVLYFLAFAALGGNQT